MLRSGDTRVRVTLTITPCIIRVCDWKIRLNSFCRSRAMRFCLVSCIVGVVFRVMCVGLFQANVLAVYLFVQKYLRILFELVFVLGGEVVCRSMFGAKRVNLWVSL